MTSSSKGNVQIVSRRLLRSSGTNIPDIPPLPTLTRRKRSDNPKPKVVSRPNLLLLMHQLRDKYFEKPDLLKSFTIEWSNAMTSRSGKTCTTNRRITISWAIMKYLPEKLLETVILREMIYAYLFVRDNCWPQNNNFLKEAARINKLTGYSISLEMKETKGIIAVYTWKCKSCGNVINKTHRGSPVGGQLNAVHLSKNCPKAGWKLLYVSGTVQSKSIKCPAK